MIRFLYSITSNDLNSPKEEKGKAMTFTLLIIVSIQNLLFSIRVTSKLQFKHFI